MATALTLRESSVDQCAECGSENLVWDSKRGEVLCSQCGLVVDEELLDAGPEWRSYTHEDHERRARGGPPPKYSLNDKGLTTRISTSNRDSSGRALKSKVASRFRRLRKWDLRKKGRIERRMTYGLADLARLSAQLRIPKSVKETASLIFRQLAERGFIRGKNTDSVTASVIYLACRQAGIPRILAEVTHFAKAKKKNIARTYKKIVRELGIHLPPINAIDLIPRFASRINLPTWVAERAIRLLERELAVGPYSGTNPGGTAAAALYISSTIHGFNCSQREISCAAHTTAVTLRKRVSEISEHLDIDISGRISPRRAANS